MAPVPPPQPVQLETVMFWNVLLPLNALFAPRVGTEVGSIAIAATPAEGVT